PRSRRACPPWTRACRPAPSRPHRHRDRRSRERRRDDGPGCGRERVIRQVRTVGTWLKVIRRYGSRMRSRRASPRRRARPRQRALPLVAMAAVLAGVSLAGCARTVIVEPAQDAANPQCADIMLTLPDEIAGEQARRTSSQGTKAWGDPSIAVLRCGVTPPGPTTDRCVSVSGVDWISRPAD